MTSRPRTCRSRFQDLLEPVEPAPPVGFHSPGRLRVLEPGVIDDHAAPARPPRRKEDFHQGRPVAPGDPHRLVRGRPADEETLAGKPPPAHSRIVPRLEQGGGGRGQGAAAADSVAIQALVLLAQAARLLVADRHHLVPPHADPRIPLPEVPGDVPVAHARGAGSIENPEPLAPGLPRPGPHGVPADPRDPSIAARLLHRHISPDKIHLPEAKRWTAVYSTVSRVASRLEIGGSVGGGYFGDRSGLVAPTAYVSQATA